MSDKSSESCPLGPIDLVYLWCDKNLQPNRAAGENAEIRAMANDDVRSRAHDELKYSLRSVFRYMPWIRNIFICVDDDQLFPDWPELKDPRIKIRRQSEFMPRDVLPVFNSCAIEICVPYLAGLAERYIYANDDNFVARPLTPDFFFDGKGRAICRFGESLLPHLKSRDSFHYRALQTSEKLVGRLTGRRLKSHNLTTHHNMNGMVKSACLELLALKDEMIERTIRSKVRTEGNVEQVVFLDWMMAKGSGVFRRRKAPLAGWLCRHFGPHFRVDSIYCALWDDFDAELRRYNPALFCVNDTLVKGDSAPYYKKMHEFFERRFPVLERGEAK